jgi:multidrug resistance efflux pump
MNENHETDGAPPAAADPESRSATLSDRVRSLRLPDQPARQPTARAWLPWLLCLLLAGSTAVLAVMAFGSRSAVPPAGPGRTDAPIPAPAGRAAVATAPGQVVLESKGYIIPVHQIQVSPKVSGMVLELHFEEGKQVKKGDVLARLETVDYEADRNRARAQLDAAWQRFLEVWTGNRPDEIRQAKAELEEARATREQLYLDWKRSANLPKTTVSMKDYELAESSYKAADRRVARMEAAYNLMLEGARQERILLAWAEIEQAAADLTKAQWRLDNCVVRAPVTGTILTKKAEEGNIVNPVAFNVAASLCDMADLSDLEVDLNIQERDIANVFKGQRCIIRPEAFPGREYKGHVSRLMPIADRAKGAVPVRVKVNVPREEEGKYLKPEMSVVVSFLAQ